MAKRRGDGDPAHPGPRVRDTIVRWLQESGNYGSIVQMPNMEFAIQGTYPRPGTPGATPLGVFIFKPATERVIGVVANVGLAPEHQTALANRSPEERAHFFRDLQRGLLFHVGMSLQNEQATQQTVAVQLAEEVYYDDSPKREDLYAAIKRVYWAYGFLSLQLQDLPPSVLGR